LQYFSSENRDEVMEVDEEMLTQDGELVVKTDLPLSAFDNIDSAIDSANNYLADAKDEMRADFVLDKNFNHYKGGYQEIEVNDNYSPTTFLISISKFNFAQ
jgi:hypothetical protein